MPEIPVIKSIHQEILRAVSSQGCTLKMDLWHTCKTTHCRGGWVVILAGEKGRALEKETSTFFAAMQIYRKSSPEIKVSPARFFDSDDKAMEDIRKCAELESQVK